MLCCLFFLLTVWTASYAQSDICQRPGCEDQTCYSTCLDRCGCGRDSEGRVPSPSYGGVCRDTGFCESEFASKEECIANGGPTCPNTMVDLDQVVEDFSTYDFRVDVRSVGEWEEDHANVSIHVPDLAKDADQVYKLQGKEGAKLLVYCKSGTRAFYASTNLLKSGFDNVNSFYDGGLPSLAATIKEKSEQSLKHPTKNLCYLTGASEICPQPLPISHIQQSSDIMNLGARVELVDVRPTMSFPDTLDGVSRLNCNCRRRVARFVAGLNGDETLVIFGQKEVFWGSDLAFKGAKAILAAGWTGPLYFVDNGGYEELKEIFS